MKISENLKHYTFSVYFSRVHIQLTLFMALNSRLSKVQDLNKIFHGNLFVISYCYGLRNLLTDVFRLKMPKVDSCPPHESFA